MAASDDRDKMQWTNVGTLFKLFFTKDVTFGSVIEVLYNNILTKFNIT